MRTTRNVPKARKSKKPETDLAARFRELQSPEILRTIAEMRAQFGQYALPIDEARRIIDEAMGDKTLTEELYAMREGR